MGEAEERIITGKVTKNLFAPGSKSESEQFFITTDGGQQYVLRMAGDNPFENKKVEPFLDKRVQATGKGKNMFHGIFTATSIVEDVFHETFVVNGNLGELTEAPEIERRFLIRRFPKTISIMSDVKKIFIEQFYTPNGRFRAEHFPHEAGINGPTRNYVKNVKTPIEGMKFGKNEKEWKLNFDEMLSGVKNTTKLINKLRHSFHIGDIKWDVDQLDCGLVIAEAEMPSEDYPLVLPPFIQEVLIMEITGIKAFDNFSLAEPIYDAAIEAQEFEDEQETYMYDKIVRSRFSHYYDGYAGSGK